MPQCLILIKRNLRRDFLGRWIAMCIIDSLCANVDFYINDVFLVSLVDASFFCFIMLVLCVGIKIIWK
jgi:hypothetical protein